MAGKAERRDRNLAALAVIRRVCCKWCDDPLLCALVGIRQGEGNHIATLWARRPAEAEIQHLQNLVDGHELRDPEISGAFSVGRVSISAGGPPERGVKGTISSGKQILGYESSSGLWYSGGSLTGLFLDCDSGKRWGITAAHGFWGTDVAVWPQPSHKYNLGPVNALSPKSAPSHGDSLTADAASIAINEVCLLGRKTSWAEPRKALRQCGFASTTCQYTNAKAKSYCIKVPYANTCVTLEDHLVIRHKSFATDGDSGALVEKRNSMEVGMIVAVSRNDEYVAVTPWRNVLAGLGLENAALKRQT